MLFGVEIHIEMVAELVGLGWQMFIGLEFRNKDVMQPNWFIILKNREFIYNIVHIMKKSIHFFLTKQKTNSIT